MFNVLIIEEGVRQSTPYKVFLEGQGYATFCIPANAGAIEEALEKQHIDVILCDYEEPAIDVITPVEFIRASGNDIPVIVLSSSDAYRAKQRAFGAGADDFMTNADTPTLATAGIIENTTNPFTGHAIDSLLKDGPQLILCSEDWNTYQNNGNTFLPGKWFRFEGIDPKDEDNWSYVDEH